MARSHSMHSAGGWVALVALALCLFGPRAIRTATDSTASEPATTSQNVALLPKGDRPLPAVHTMAHHGMRHAFEGVSGGSGPVVPWCTMMQYR